MKFKWKLSETLYIKELHPSLNMQEISVALKLLAKFQWWMWRLLRHLEWSS